MTTHFETNRLILRVIDERDQAFIYKQFSNDIVNQYLFDAEPVQNLDEALEIINFYRHTTPKRQERFMMVLKDTHETIGTLGYHAHNEETHTLDIGYDLYPSYMNQGYMQEALTFLIDYVKNHLQVKTINACIYKDNLRSIHAVKRFGFTYYKDTYEHFRGEDYLHHVYQLTFK